MFRARALTGILKCVCILHIIRLTGTVAQPNKFHDDPRTYTVVHKAGGPTTIDHDKQGLDQLLDRSAADVRGLKKV